MNTEIGVNYYGFFSEISGIAQATRSNALALEKNNLKINYKSYVYTHKIEKYNDPLYKASSENYPINIFHINIDKINTFLSEFTTDVLKDKYNIAYWAWEFPEVPEEVLNTLNLFDELWVPSNFCADIFASKSKIPVIKVAHPIEGQPINFTFNKSDYSISKDSFIYLTLFDSDSTFERKNPIDTIKAFQESFEPTDNHVTLVVKTHNFEKNLEIKKQIEETIANYTNIVVIDEKMSHEKLHSLIQQANVLLSLHASEGFGLTLAEAMSYGKIVIGTGFSGNTDFMNINNSFPLKYTLTGISNEHGIIKKGFTIAKPDLSHAKELIQYCYKEFDSLNTLQERAKSDIQSNFNPNILGKLMADRLSLIQHNFINTSSNKQEQMIIYDYEVTIEKLNKRIKYLEKSIYNKLRKGINKLFKQLKQIVKTS